METRAHYVLIGAFVLSAVAAAMLFILWMSQTQRQFDEYDVIFTERVSGLSIGSIVRFNGIQKGEVEDLIIDPEDPSIVVARVRVENDTPVKTDTKAELELVGFTGLAIIQFVGGSPEAPLLKEVSERAVPRIQADTSGFAAILEGGGDLLSRATLALSDENIESLSDILSNIEKTTDVLAENREDISNIIKNASVASKDLAEISGRLNNAADGLETMLAERGPAALEDAEALLSESRALVGELHAIVGENRASFRVFADQGLGQVAPALSELRRLMRTLDYMLREIDRDPQAYFLGENAPEYGTKEE